MIRRAKEGEITWLSGLSVSDIPNNLPDGITLHIKDDTLGLEVQGLVGALPLKNGDSVQIIPKIGQVNFLRLLFRAEGNQRELNKAFKDFVEYSVDDEANIDQIAARHLLYSIDEILRRSPQRGRIRRRHLGNFAIGQIDPIATAINILCHKDEPVIYLSKDKTEDIAENRVITDAIIRAWPMLDDGDRFALSGVYERWISRFPRSKNLSSDLEDIENRLAKNNYGGSRDYYRIALTLSKIVLGNSGIGFDNALIISGDAILLNTADVFEKYLRNVISESHEDRGYIITKDRKSTISLYTDGSYELIPDIVISRTNRILLIADAKYKLPISGDHYQMAAYLTACGVKRGLLLYPLFNGHETIIREYITSNKAIVRELFLPMENLNATEEILATVVERFAA